MITINTVAECNRYFSQCTWHPLAGMADISATGKCDLLQMGLYAVLCEEHPCAPCFGRKECDFSDGRMLFISPGQRINLACWNRYAQGTNRLLCFHPDLLQDTLPAVHLDDYSFFRYRQNEALHLSCRELEVAKSCMAGIAGELQWGVDEFSRSLLAGRIGLLLNYGRRFYKRQFITRHEAHECVLRRTDELLDSYLLSGKAPEHGLPTAEYFARMQVFSPAYFDDLLRHETGQSAKEYVQARQFGMACEQLLHTAKSVSCIARELGYSSLQQFCCLFKRLKGCAPDDYRLLN